MYLRRGRRLCECRTADWGVVVEIGDEPTGLPAEPATANAGPAPPEQSERIHQILLIVGLLLLAGGCSILITGFGIDVEVPGSLGVRIAAIVLGTAACAAAFMLWPSLDSTRRTALTVGAIALGLGLFGLVRLADPLVPDVRGLNDENAIHILSQLGVAATAVPTVSDAPVGEVVLQTPEGGSRSQRVTLQVASRQAPRLPDVRGFAEEDARRVFEDLGVTVTVEAVAGDSAGDVTEMVPMPRTRSFSVQLYVATGVPAPEMIDVRGQTADAATTALAERGIEATVEEVEAPEAAGTVVDQRPTAGEPTTAAALVVSAGPGLPVVPAVVNAAEADALDALQASSISVTVERAPSDDVPAGIVTGVVPAVGERTTEVTLSVSSGPTFAAFVGDWHNVDPSTSGMVELRVAGREGTATMTGFGACTPEACEWGAVEADVDGDQLVGMFDLGFKQVEVRISRAGPLLAATVVHRYGEGDDRDDRTESHTLSLEPVEDLTVDDLQVIANSELLDVVVSSGAAAEIPQLAPVVLPESVGVIGPVEPGS